VLKASGVAADRRNRIGNSPRPLLPRALPVCVTAGGQGNELRFLIRRARGRRATCCVLCSCPAPAQVA
jgi:hypothetical protein